MWICIFVGIYIYVHRLTGTQTHSNKLSHTQTNIYKFVFDILMCIIIEFATFTFGSCEPLSYSVLR